MSDKDKLDGVVRAYKAEFHRGLLAEREFEKLRSEAAAMSTALQKVEYLEAEIASLRLTDEEREAVERAVMRSDADAQMIGGEFYSAAKNMRQRSATLRGLLTRLD